MANLTWTETPTLRTAMLDGVAVCELRSKDIGGVTANWLDGRLWPPPSHMPKAAPQQTRFFMNAAEAVVAVEEILQGS